MNTRRTMRLFEELDAARAQGALVALTGAGVSDALLLEDHRRQRIQKTIASWAHDRGMRTITFSQGWGAEFISPPGVSELKDEPPGRRLMNPDEQLAALIDEVRTAKIPTTIALDWTDILLQDNGTVSDAQAVILQRVAHLAGDGLFRMNGHFLAMLVRSGHLNRRLRSSPA